jgi:hypothetical protein
MAAPPTTLEEDANWAVDRATSLSEVWALVAENGDGLVDAWRLMGVCQSSRTGVKGWLGTLPGFVVCGGYSHPGGRVRRLDLATLRWEPMPALVIARRDHACCTVRGNVAVLGGETQEEGNPISSEAEMLSSGAFCGSPAVGTRRDSWCSRDRGGRERQRRRTGALTRSRGC